VKRSARPIGTDSRFPANESYYATCEIGGKKIVESEDDVFTTQKDPEPTTPAL
jgi:hypothetical protein